MIDGTTTLPPLPPDVMPVGPLTLNTATTNTSLNGHGYPHDACTNLDHDASMNDTGEGLGRGRKRQGQS